MSYIHCPYDNYYKSGESLHRLFENLVVRPFERHPQTQPWATHVRNTNFTYHREKILEQGRTNFDEYFEGLTSKDKVLIYCLHYMPMHLFSSYHIFTKHLELGSDKVIFIDFGCGPLTSGIAFWAAFAGYDDLAYFGIDSSDWMRHKGDVINRHGPYGDEPFFPKSRFISDYNLLYQSLCDYITTGDQTHIIFNFCYFLASKTLNIGDLSDCLIQIVAKYSQHKMCMVYQNPKQSPDLHRNWHTIKGKLPTLRGQMTPIKY